MAKSVTGYPAYRPNPELMSRAIEEMATHLESEFFTENAYQSLSTRDAVTIQGAAHGDWSQTADLTWRLWEEFGIPGDELLDKQCQAVVRRLRAFGVSEEVAKQTFDDLLAQAVAGVLIKPRT